MKRLLSPFHEIRPNAGVPAAAPAECVVGHQTPFPWLNTVVYLPALEK